MTGPGPRLATRAQEIEPFYAVEIYRRALARAESGRTVLMCIGEPDFPTPAHVVEAAAHAAQNGATHYTMPLGIPPLRTGIAAQYADRHGIDIDPERIVVTVGASGALTLAFGAIAEPGDEILMADPGYPSNRACLTFCGARAGLIAVGPEERFQLTAALVDRHWGPRTRGVMIASPSNPTGTTIEPAELAAIHDVVRSRGGVLLVDEIYHGLTYGHRPPSAVALGDDVFVVNSFSKYYCMTGWRLGWLVVPPAYHAAVERMQSHFFICPPAPSQWAGVAALQPASTTIFEVQRAELERRRDYLVPALDDAGLHVACRPDGAFYCYTDVSAFTEDSWAFAVSLLDATGVAVTPGRDFGAHDASRFVRISFTSSLPDLSAGVAAIRAFLGR
ncbi:MAG: aminotransferase class I/II-fold pyridoxal phosphate-dependent enzyme [Gemmatimonadaceae bacterium]|nr:aminotransferase class I/II-fold pyridoxal phosphate-dependent enzyme [Gemmatimonadaceae bacterium]